MRHAAIAVLALGALASAPAAANEKRHHADDRDAHHGDHRSATIEMLEDRDDALQRRSMQFRIGAVERQEIAQQRGKIEDMIDQLEAGQKIDRHELDEALGNPYHGTAESGYCS